jgi:hypothetical protein
VPTSTKHSLVGPIVGGVVGGIAVLSFLVVAFLLVSRRRRARESKTAPYYGQASPKSFEEDVRHEMPSETTGDASKGFAVKEVAPNQINELQGSETVAKGT